MVNSNSELINSKSNNVTLFGCTQNMANIIANLPFYKMRHRNLFLCVEISSQNISKKCINWANRQVNKKIIWNKILRKDSTKIVNMCLIFTNYYLLKCKSQWYLNNLIFVLYCKFFARFCTMNSFVPLVENICGHLNNLSSY